MSTYTFQNIQDYINQLNNGPITQIKTKLFDVNDNYVLFQQINNICDQFDKQFESLMEQQQIQDTKSINSQDVNSQDMEEYNNYIKGLEEQPEEEFSEKDILNLNDEDAKNVEMALRLDESSDESTQSQTQSDNNSISNDNTATSSNLNELIKKYEQQLVGQKQWQYNGETYSDQRQKNALLDELPNMELKLKMKQKLQLTEQLNQELEKVIIERIKNQNFDDPHYKEQQVEEENEIKEISTERNQVGLSDQINKIGLRQNVPQLILEKRKELEEQFKDIQTEIRSYFKYM